MGKVIKKNCESDRVTPCSLPSCCKKAVAKVDLKRKHLNRSKEKDYKDATCPVCLEAPHNAVLLLCSSYHKGCRPYMCGTSRHFSNCLDQYKTVYGDARGEKPELVCPLCRGQVKGWTVVEEAREFLNSKKRACDHENCAFVGSFRYLRNHIKEKHQRARPRKVDPILEEKWKKLELERDQRDAISTILSSTPGAVVMGDYVVEPYENGSYEDENDLDHLDLDSTHGQPQPRHSRFFDLEYDEFPPSRPSMTYPGLSLRHLILGRTRSRSFRRANRGR